jgi:hypothetical protein
VIAYRYSTIIYWTKFPWVSIFFKKRFSPFERRFPYLLLWNFSDGTGWEILRGARNAWHKNWGYRVSVSFLYISSLWYGASNKRASDWCNILVLIFAVLVLCTQVNKMLVILLWVYIHTGQAWKICLSTVGIEPTTFGIYNYFMVSVFGWP